MLSSSGSMWSVFSGNNVSILIGLSFLYNSIYVLFELHSQHYHFSFLCCTLSLLASYICWLFSFVKCHMGLSQGDKKTTQTCSLLSGHELNSRYIMVIHWQHLKKWCDWSLILIYFYSDLWNELLTAEFVLIANIHD